MRRLAHRRTPSGSFPAAAASNSTMVRGNDPRNAASSILEDSRVVAAARGASTCSACPGQVGRGHPPVRSATPRAAPPGSHHLMASAPPRIPRAAAVLHPDGGTRIRPPAPPPPPRDGACVAHGHQAAPRPWSHPTDILSDSITALRKCEVTGPAPVAATTPHHNASLISLSSRAPRTARSRGRSRESQTGAASSEIDSLALHEFDRRARSQGHARRGGHPGTRPRLRRSPGAVPSARCAPAPATVTAYGWSGVPAGNRHTGPGGAAPTFADCLR